MWVVSDDGGGAVVMTRMVVTMIMVKMVMVMTVKMVIENLNIHRGMLGQDSKNRSRNAFTCLQHRL